MWWGLAGSVVILTAIIALVIYAERAVRDTDKPMEEYLEQQRKQREDSDHGAGPWL